MTLNRYQLMPGKGVAIDQAGGQDQLYRKEVPPKRQVEITAIPYCVWDNPRLAKCASGCAPEIGNPK